MNWLAHRTVFHCRSCDCQLAAGAETMVACPWCGGAVQKTEAAFTEPPELAIDFVIDKAAAADALAYSLKKVAAIFRPRDLTGAKLNARLSQVYLPMWLVDVDVDATWTSDVGFEFDVRTHVESATDGQWQTTEQKRKHIDWQVRCGSLKRHFDNIRLPALDDHGALMLALGPFAFDRARPWHGDAGTIVLPQISPSSLRPASAAGARGLAASVVQSACGGQHLERFSIEDIHSGHNWTLLLLPIWSTWYVGDDDEVYALRVHGQKGFVQGELHRSQKRGTQVSWLLAATAVAAIAAGFFLPVAPSVIRAFLVLVGLLVMMLSPLPWRFAAKVETLQAKR